MNRATLISVFLSLSAVGSPAQMPVSVDIDSVTVRASRPLADAGLTAAHLDTLTLRDNPSKSLADVLAGNTSLYVKNYGRGTMASVSVRGTAPSHTQLLWNGMKISSPMLGSADYSLIPSYFIDRATLLYGAGAVDAAGGGFGGAVILASAPRMETGPGLQFIQGIGSYLTFDNFLRISYGTPRLRLSTRIYRASSRNDFRYVNYDKNPDRNGSYPVERNRSASFRDLHILQDIYYKLSDLSKLDASVWFMDSRRNIPLTSVSYREEDNSVNRQRETTLRAVAGWERNSAGLKLGVRAGLTLSQLDYLRLEDTGNGELNPVSDARNRIHTGFGELSAGYYPAHNLMLTASLSAYLHSVSAIDKVNHNGYDGNRIETSLKFGARYEPVRIFAFGGEARGESYGRKITPPIWLAFAEFLLWDDADMRLRVSGGHNYRYPSLNDLYYRPGGNPDLSSESGYSYEVSLESGVTRERFIFRGRISAYYSWVDGWILWLYGGSNGGAVWSPENVGKVHAYGIELSGRIFAAMGRGWSLRIDGSWNWTPSVNRGRPIGENDASAGKQLPYIPLFSTSVTGRLAWRSCAFVYKFSHYSERFTTSSNDYGYNFGVIGTYYMNDAALEKKFSPHWGVVSLQFCINNLFNEEYVSVLSRPMPRMNFGFFAEITPNLGRGRTGARRNMR